jgi:hypothetical protein
MRGYQYYPRRRSGAKWLLVLLAVGVVIWYANSQGIINLSLPNLGNLSISGNQSSMIENCMQKVNACGTIINSKYGATVNLLKQTQIGNADDANAFLKTWKGTTQSGDISTYSLSSYPITMIATRFDNSDSTKTPYVFICKSDGTFEDKTTAGLC